MASQVYFPAVNFRVSAVVVSAEAMSPIEDHMLRAIQSGIETLDGLAGLLGLHLRFAMEILNRMLRRNLVMIDFRTGRFGIPHAVQDALESQSEPTPSGPERSQITEYALCLNRCTGGLTGRRHLRMIAPDEPALVYQPDRSYEITDLDAARIERAINQLIRAAGLHVRDVNPASARPEVEGGLIAEASCLDWEDGSASVTLRFDARQNVPPHEISELEAMVLTARSERRWWWNRLGPRQAGKGAGTATRRCIPYGVAALTARFDARDTALTPDRAIQTLEHLVDLTQSSVVVEPIIGAASLVREVAQLARDAHDQLVLVCPDLAEDGVNDIVPCLGSRGPAGPANTLVVHGVEQADGSVSPLVSRLAGVPGMVDPTHGSPVHAKLVLQDATSALVTTKDYLSSGARSAVLDVGVTLRGGGPVIDDLLLWTSRVAAPEIARKGSWRGNDFAGPKPAGSSHSLPMLEVPQTFTALVDQVAERLQRSGARMDCEAFAQSVLVATKYALRSPEANLKLEIQAAEMTRFIQRVVDDLEASHRAVVEVVSTTSHRAFLFDALERAERVVVVASHRIGRASLGPNFRKALRRALDRGITVGLLWGQHSPPSRPRANPEAPDPADALLAQLMAIAEGAPGQLVINRTPLDIHCKLLVLDGTAALITSYDLLDFIESHEHTRNELGLWIDSQRVAAAMLTGLHDHVRAVHPDFAGKLAAALERRVSRRR